MSKIEEQNLKRFYFELNEQKPVELLVNNHLSESDYWFDMHYELEIGLLMRGRMKREYLGHETILHPGQVWLCSMWEPHGFELLDIPCEVVVFVIDPQFLAKNNLLNIDMLAPFMVSPEKRPQFSGAEKDKALQLGESAKTVLKDSERTTEWAKLQVLQLLLMLNEQWRTLPNEDQKFAKHLSIHSALQLVFNEKRLITTEEAAQTCGLSASSFRQRFKDLMGTSFSDFALQYRVRGAAADLKHSNQTQEAVAMNWGFTDASHLHKYLKR